MLPQSCPPPKSMLLEYAHHSRIRRSQFRVVGMIAVFVCGCGQDIAGSGHYTIVAADTAVLTHEVAQTLTPAGLFSLSGPQMASSDELNETQVRIIARAWVRQFFPWVRGRLETQHGSKLDATNLRDCARIYYAESPYESVPDVADGGVARRVYGPWWLVPLCAGGEPQVLLGVAGYAIGIHIEQGRIVLPNPSGGEFVWKGIPPGVQLPLPPEIAASRVAGLTGSRIASVPRLILPNFRDGSPALARWEMAINPSVALTTQGQQAGPKAAVFMGPRAPGSLGPTLQEPMDDQPVTVPIRTHNRSTRSGDYVITLKRKAGLPVRFRAVEVKR
jgi:hypothetical protein